MGVERNKLERESIQARPTGSQVASRNALTSLHSLPLYKGAGHPRAGLQEPGGDNTALQTLTSFAAASKHRGEAARVLGRLDGKGGPEAAAADGDGILVVAGGSGAGLGHGQPTGGSGPAASGRWRPACGRG